MRLNVAGFVDVGFVRAAVASACGIDPSRVRLDAAALVRAVEQVASSWSGLVLRVYWFDGQYALGDPRHTAQLKYLDAVAATPGIQLRLGHVFSRTPAWHAQLQQALSACGVDRREFSRHFTFAPEYQQKGVDTLMVLDIVRLAQRRAYDIAVIFSGDRDIAEAVRAAQDEGRRVTLIVPDDKSVAAELRALADEVIVFDAEMLRSLNRPQPKREQPQAATRDTEASALAAEVPQPDGHRGRDVVAPAAPEVGAGGTGDGTLAAAGGGDAAAEGGSEHILEEPTIPTVDDRVGVADSGSDSGSDGSDTGTGTSSMESTGAEPKQPPAAFPPTAPAFAQAPPAPFAAAQPAPPEQASEGATPPAEKTPATVPDDPASGAGAPSGLGQLFDEDGPQAVGPAAAGDDMAGALFGDTEPDGLDSATDMAGALFGDPEEPAATSDPAAGGAASDMADALFGGGAADVPWGAGVPLNTQPATFGSGAPGA